MRLTISTQLSAGRRDESSGQRTVEEMEVKGANSLFAGPVGTFYSTNVRETTIKYFGLAPCSVRGYTCVL